MKIIQILLILTLFSFFFACQKGEQGDIGPAGAKGIAGVTGDKGEVGINNSKGMLVSPWVEVKAAEWQAFGSNAFRVAFTLPALTTDIANKGNVYFYMQPAGASFVYPMPYSEGNGAKFFGNLVNVNNTQGLYLYYGFIPALGSFKLTTDYKFRLVIIPAAARITTQIDWGNYESVKKYLDLKD